MPGRHATPSRVRGRARGRQRRRARVPVVAGAVALVLVVGAAVVWATGRGEEAVACTRDSFTVAAAPDVADALETSIAGTSSSAACRSYTVRAVTPEELTQRASEGETPPDLWLPDASLAADRVADESVVEPEPLARSVATSPVLVVGTKDAVGEPANWLGVMRSGRVRLGDVPTSTIAATAVLATRVEAGPAETAVSSALAPLAQAEATAGRRTQAQLLAAAAEGGGATVATEQQWLAARKTSPDLVAVAPDDTAAFLDHPLYLTAASDRRTAARDAGRELVRRLATGPGRSALTEAGFRARADSPPRGGVDDVVPLVPDDRGLLADTVRRWAVLALPTRALTVIDVSGSMREKAGDGTRMSLTIEAALRARRLFPDNAAVGLWAFSVGIGPQGRDYDEIVPTRPMTAVTSGRSQRTALDVGTTSLAGRVGGGTGLYDTVLASYRTAQAGYDPRAVNCVILLTDGQNEDPGSLGLRELLDRLEAEADPARPVVVVTIGITEDADAAALSRISRATGGSSYIARSPDDIPSVFVRSLLARAER